MLLSKAVRLSSYVPPCRQLTCPRVVAGVSTDTGHASDAGDGSWALGNDVSVHIFQDQVCIASIHTVTQNAIIDYGWRALHLSIVAGKQLTEQYYAQYIGKSYYMGCSTGEYAAVDEELS